MRIKPPNFTREYTDTRAWIFKNADLGSEAPAPFTPPLLVAGFDKLSVQLGQFHGASSPPVTVVVTVQASLNAADWEDTAYTITDNDKLPNSPLDVSGYTFVRAVLTTAETGTLHADVVVAAFRTRGSG